MRTMIDTCRENKDEKRILFRWTQAKLCARSKEQWPYVHRCPCPMRRHILCVQTHSQMHASFEVINGYFRYRDEAGTVLHTLCILLRSKDVDSLVIWRSKRFESLVALLSVVEAWCHAMETQEWIFHELRWGPFAGLLRIC